MMGEHVNIFDIASEAGVSIATVSRVMSGRGNVKPETRDKVMAVVQKYNFKPNMMATGLSKRKSHTIGMVMPLVENPYYTRLYMAAQKEARRFDYQIMLHQFERGSILDQSFADLLIGKRHDGLIISGDISTEMNTQSVTSCISQVREYMPIVLINPNFETENCVVLRNGIGDGMRMAVQHMARLGHRRIALLGGDGNTNVINSREYAYMDELSRLGLEDWYPLTVGQTHDEGETCALRLMAQLGRRQPPSAVIAFNDMVALGALKQLKKLGIRIPDDMALVSCDNLFFAPYTDPPLTSIDLQIEDLGRLAVHVLAKGDAQGTNSFEQMFEPTLVVRESCGSRK